MVVGGKIGGSAVSNDADFRGPLGGLIGIGGFLVFMVPTIGLIALIVSRFAKSTVVRVFSNFLGSAAVLLVVGGGVLVVYAYLSLEGATQRASDNRARLQVTLLAQAEQGDASSQQQLGDIHYYERECLRDDTLVCHCPEALHWYRQAAFQNFGRSLKMVNTAYDCAPGDVESNVVLAHVWRNISIGSPSGSPANEWALQSFERRTADLGLESDAIAAMLTTAEKLTIRGLEIFADPDMSAADRELAMDGAVRELMPRMNGDIDD